MLTYTITGTDLNTDDLTVTLGGTNDNLFTITASAGTVSGNILTITPANGAIAATIVTIAFDPTATGDFSANLTHEGAGLASSVVLNITGTGTDATTPTTDNTLGIVTNLNGIALSPNPVTNHLFVQGNGTLQVAIRNITGTLLGTYEILNAGTIPFNRLPQGIYIVQIQTKQGNYTQRILRR